MTANVLKRRTCASVLVIFSHAIAAIFQIAISFVIYFHDRRATSDSEETPTLTPTPNSGHVSVIAAIGSIVHVITLSVFHLWNEMLAARSFHGFYSPSTKRAITAVLSLITLGSSFGINVDIMVVVGFSGTNYLKALFSLFSLIFGNVAVMFKIFHGCVYS